MISESEILKFTRSRRYGPMTVDQIARKLEVRNEDFEAFLKLVRELELAGELVEVKDRCLADPARVDLVVGTLLCNPRGFAFLKPARPEDGDDLYISTENMSSALHGDLVVARVPPSARRGDTYITRRHEARHAHRRRAPASASEVKVVSVLKRARSEIVGTLRREGNVWFVIPDDPRLFRDVLIGDEDVGQGKMDDKVSVRITTWPSRHMNPAGEISRVFGPRGQLEAELLSVTHEYNLRREFPPEVLRAAEALPEQVRPEDLRERRDLTEEMIFTVDPKDARDFDDAVSLRRLPDGGWELGVHIADVAHYVRPDDPIDREARLRGTSVYLPGQVIPMLPERLSNGLCSLQPNVIRLTKTARMTFDAQGQPVRAEVYASFIRSCRRFTYEEVQAVIDGGELPAGEAEIGDKVREMNTLAELLRARRHDRGMLEMDIPEPHILTDADGRTTGVELKRADPSHRLIEQFMLAANETVANHLLKRRLPYLCRAHDEPDAEALQSFRETARVLGHSFPAPGTRQQIQRFLERLHGRPEAYLLNYLLLRSMKLAIYSSEDVPHYAIGAAHYLHFTSPIRRYPDLLAHRILEEEASGLMEQAGRREYWRDGLPGWTAHATETERNADYAERTLTNRRLMDFIAQRDVSLEALITGIENYGLRVQLTQYMLDGVVRFSALSDSFYQVNRERGIASAPGRRQFKVGQRIHVRVLRYNEFKHQMEFEVVGKKA